MADLHARNALVLYGSETGNAQEIAEEISRLCERLHFQVKLSTLNGVGIVSQLQQHKDHVEATMRLMTHLSA